MSDVYDGLIVNDTTKFCLALLIIWVIVTFILSVLASLGFFALPRALKSSTLNAFMFLAAQAAVLALAIAALAYDSWSETDGSPVFSYGVLRVHKKGSSEYSYKYECGGTWRNDSEKNECRGLIASGISTLVFGIIACLVGLILLLALLGEALSKSTPLSKGVTRLATIQWLCLLAQVIIWGVCFNQVMRENTPGYEPKLGTSWILCLVSFLVAFGSAIMFGNVGVERNLGDTFRAF